MHIGGAVRQCSEVARTFHDASDANGQAVNSAEPDLWLALTTTRHVTQASSLNDQCSAGPLDPAGPLDHWQNTPSFLALDRQPHAPEGDQLTTRSTVQFYLEHRRKNWRGTADKVRQRQCVLTVG